MPQAQPSITVRWKSTTDLSVSPRVLFSWNRVTATITVESDSPTPPSGTVVLKVNGKPVKAELVLGADGSVSYKLPKLSRGLHLVKAYYGGSDAVAGSESGTRLVLVLF